jgi:cyclase
VELAARYALEGADELVFLDITATHEKRKTLAELASHVAQAINIPFTVGGGIVSVDDALVLLHSGADKVSINSAAVRRPELISELAARFGSQCVVLAVDARQTEKGWEVYLNGGRIPTGIELFAWVSEGVERGAGEILFTSMDHDGTRNGFANEALLEMSQRFSVPLIASGGAGNMEHFADTFVKGKADAALAAGIFHYHEVAIPDLKQYLFNKKIPVRIS